MEPAPANHATRLWVRVDVEKSCGQFGLKQAYGALQSIHLMGGLTLLLHLIEGLGVA